MECNNQEFEYMMLSRLIRDIGYYCGAGNGHTKHLWAGNVDEQIKEIFKIYNLLIVKPQWLTFRSLKKQCKKLVMYQPK
ncbi:MAG: hypothetical protein GY829_05865 [Gammaproteobacteria bacterium]|nr:hypothetical protein [Gammaproteobacteria bacterium]